MSLPTAMGGATLVGIGEMLLTSGEPKVLVARCLGSSAALAIVDPITGVGGIIHWMLPAARIDPHRAARNPWMFADTGLPRFLDGARSRGARADSLLSCLAGAAVTAEGGNYDVGARNQEQARRLIAQAGIILGREETGGTVVRDLYLRIDPADFLVRRLDF